MHEMVPCLRRSEERAEREQQQAKLCHMVSRQRSTLLCSHTVMQEAQRCVSAR